MAVPTAHVTLASSIVLSPFLLLSWSRSCRVLPGRKDAPAVDFTLPLLLEAACCLFLTRILTNEPKIERTIGSGFISGSLYKCGAASALLAQEPDVDDIGPDNDSLRSGTGGGVNCPRNCVVIVARGIFSNFDFERFGGLGG